MPDKLDKLKKANDKEFRRLLHRIDEINNSMKIIPETEGHKMYRNYLGEVYLKFFKWYKTNNYDLPSIKSLLESVKPDISKKSEIINLKSNLPSTQVTKRLNLSPNKNEILNSKIVNEVNDFTDAGKGSQEKAYTELSKKSPKLFGYQLTPKQIEGRYSRNKKKHF
ncbi:MAG: hypothetical protein V1720_14815 [bacterium]